MAERPTRYRRYTASDKAEAVGIALVEGVVEAERRTGIPRETLSAWRTSPEYAEARDRTRDELVADLRAAFSLALDRLVSTITDGPADLRGLTAAVDMLGTRLALLEGHATERVETRALLEGLDDHEREALSEALDGWIAEREAEERASPETVHAAEEAYRAALEGRVVYVVPEDATGDDREALRAAAAAYVETVMLVSEGGAPSSAVRRSETA